MNTKDIEWLLRDKYNGIETEAFKRDVERLKTGEPLAYVIGWMPFLNVKMYLDSRPLIPRPETEYWASKAISEIKDKLMNTRCSSLRILDLCAGSGCIGVAVLVEIPNAQVDFAEIDLRHHQTIRKNVQENGIDPARTYIFGGDLFENIKEEYDAILSNPPYIDPELTSRIQDSVSKHEPSKALYGGKGGMKIIEKILLEAPKHLKPGGILYIEHEPEQVKKIVQRAPTIQSYTDQFGVIRFSRLQI